LEIRQRYVDAIRSEFALRANYLSDPVHTIYLGGGTPSQLENSQLQQLFDTVGSAEEVTIECNPDDVTEVFSSTLAQLPVNRVSMGVQTFSDERLRFLRRRHSSAQIAVAIDRLRRVGINNISIDLMFGFPNETLSEWHNDISKAIALQVEHISAYSLMYEEGTPLYAMLKMGKVVEVDEEMSRQMYYDLKDRLEIAGYEHYEISNFAKIRPVAEGSYRSLHNSNYWNQTPYLGLGAGAHSFDGRSRQWNPDDIDHYIVGIEEGRPVFEHEDINDNTRYNELIMTCLRTSEGLPLSLLTATQRDYCLRLSRPFLNDGLLMMQKDHLRLSRRGLFVSDMIMSELMKV